MKKLLLTAAATTVLATSSAMAAGEEFYGSIHGGMNKLNDLKPVKSESAGHAGVSVGYHINDMFRAEVEFTHLFEPKQKNKMEILGVKLTNTLKIKVDSLMVNGYADVFDAGMVKFYVGAGAGAARVSGKFTATNDATGKSESFKFKNKTNFAYAAHLGISAELSSGIHGFAQYSWKDYGKLEKNSDVEGKNKSDIRGHHGTVGIRVSF